MDILFKRWLLAAVVVAMSTAASAGPEDPPGTQLDVVTVAAPAVNCVYSKSCTITVDDSVGQLALANLDKPNSAWLQSRTFTGAADTPGAGKTGYEYRLDMTQASGSLECVAGFVINFGPITKLPFINNTPPADVYVVTQGGLGTIGLASAMQSGDVITFTFDKLVCASMPASAANTTYFFGLASAHPPKGGTAGIFGTGNPPYYAVGARAPNH
jgi:hypothetical protein